VPFPCAVRAAQQTSDLESYNLFRARIENLEDQIARIDRPKKLLKSLAHRRRQSHPGREILPSARCEGRATSPPVNSHKRGRSRRCLLQQRRRLIRADRPALIYHSIGDSYVRRAAAQCQTRPPPRNSKKDASSNIDITCQGLRRLDLSSQGADLTIRLDVTLMLRDRYIVIATRNEYHSQ
jgi:hypothetical protein